MSKKALIFGVNGFVGSYLVNELTRSGYDVFGSDRSSECLLEDVQRFYPADLSDRERVKEVIDDIVPDYIVNLAAISSVGLSWKIPQDTIQVNVIGALNVLDAAKDQPEPPKVLLIGSSEEYAPSTDPLSEESKLDASNPYGISKVTQEKMAEVYYEKYEVPVYKVRAFNHTGVGQSPNFVLPNWCMQAASIDNSGKGGVINVGNVDVARDFSDVRDIVRGYRLLLESQYMNEVFNLGSGNAYQLADMLELILSFSEVEIEPRVDPELMRPTDNPIIYCDNRKARSLLGWDANISIEQTLREMFESYLAGIGR